MPLGGGAPCLPSSALSALSPPGGHSGVSAPVCFSSPLHEPPEAVAVSALCLEGQDSSLWVHRVESGFPVSPRPWGERPVGTGREPAPR